MAARSAVDGFAEAEDRDLHRLLYSFDVVNSVAARRKPSSPDLAGLEFRFRNWLTDEQSNRLLRSFDEATPWWSDGRYWSRSGTPACSTTITSTRALVASSRNPSCCRMGNQGLDRKSLIINALDQVDKYVDKYG